MPDTPDDMRVQVGDIVAGKYRVDRILGEGGMGVVVAATHDQLGQTVALKFLLPTVAVRPDLVERFMREARAAVRIQSEHVARVFDVGQHGMAPYMVMEYLEGNDLSKVIAARGPLSIRESVGYLLEVCDAVAEAHSLGIIHRDLKPANMFLAKRPSGKPIVKVLDFGISKSPVTERDAAITNATAIMGSPSYMSPEQMVASASVDVRSDVWSLGVVLYEMLSRQLPFTANSMPELVGIILQGSFPPLVNVRTDVSGEPTGGVLELQAIIDKCLQKQRELRFQNVAELARALAPYGPSRSEALVERIESVLGLSSGIPSSVPAPLAPSALRSQPGAVAVPPASMTFAPTTAPLVRKRSPVVIIAPIVALVGVMAIGVAVFVHAKGQASAPSSTPLVTSTTPTATAIAVIPTEPTVTADPLPTAPVVADTGAAQNVGHSKPHASSHPSATASASASAAPGCRTVSYFDSSGNKHFKLECPP